jgi:hypothetical protein
MMSGEVIVTSSNPEIFMVSADYAISFNANSNVFYPATFTHHPDEEVI